jgi:hypothetical protein
MEYRLEVLLRPGYLHVRVRGDNTVETIHRYIQEVRRACLQESCPVVLIEENLQGPGLGIGEMYEVISEESRDRSPAIHRIVFVDVNPDHDLADMKFAETMAANRAMDFHVFPTVADAESWIHREPARATRT